MKTYLIIAAVAVFITAPSLASAVDDMRHGMKMEAASSSAADEQFNAAMQNMMSSEAKPTGNPDRDFVSMMVPHHQGAIDMARVELQYGKDPMLRKMAADIIKAQEKEIAAMKAWQARNAR